MVVVSELGMGSCLGVILSSSAFGINRGYEDPFLCRQILFMVFGEELSS